MEGTHDVARATETSGMENEEAGEDMEEVVKKRNLTQSCEEVK